MIGTLLNERFALESELGRGGMGAVYHATDQLLGRAVAIKVLKELSGEEVGKKIRLEAQILARLLHEHIVRLYDFGIASGAYFLVMEEVDGPSFRKQWRSITIPERMRILAQVAEALAYAHHQGVIHRDVKPANILLTSSGQAKLSDFGLSLLAQDSHESGFTRGTPHFMSPEQARGKKLDHRSDLYSVGVILYECVTGTTPFEGKGAAVMTQHVKDRPQPPRERNPEISPELEALVLRLLAKNVDERPPSGQAVAAELRALLENDRWKAPADLVSAAASAVVVKKPAAVATPVPVVQPPLVAPAATVATSLPGATPALARMLIDIVEAEPIILSADERYLCGHYLAYMLGGARRRGFLGRRPLDARNADRARLLLAMTSIMVSGATEASIVLGADLIETRAEVRPALSPIVVAKYLASRSTDLKRKRFRKARKQLLEASSYAQRHMVDQSGMLNPGLMPQTLDDLRTIAPERTEVDDELVERWNRVADAWRSNFDFREAVLRYATHDAYRDAASYNMWPEVVYPLIERARWQRRARSGLEAVWDALCGNLHLSDAGLRFDHAIQQAVPVQVAAQLDLALGEFEEDPRLAQDDGQDPEAGRLSIGDGLSAVSLEEIAAQESAPLRGPVRLATPDPTRMTLGELAALWREAMAALRTRGAKMSHKPVPVGPYRLVVIPSVRGRSAGTVAIQGMPNKQIELLTPSLRGAGSASSPAVAIWVYQNGSLVVAYVDFQHVERFILWDAATAQQTNFDHPAPLQRELDQIGLEIPDQLGLALSKRFRPRNLA